MRILLEVARLRTVARAGGIADISVQGNHVRFGPVELRESQELRLQRLYPRSILKPALRTILVPKPMTAPVGGRPLRDREVLAWAGDVIRAVVMDNVGQAAVVAAAAARAEPKPKGQLVTLPVRRLVAVLALGAALVTAGCGTTRAGPAAVVDGSVISQSDVTSAMQQVNSMDPVLLQSELTPSGTLTALIQAPVILDFLAERGLVVSSRRHA